MVKWDQVHATHTIVPVEVEVPVVRSLAVDGGSVGVVRTHARHTHTHTHTHFAPASRIGADGGSPGLLQPQDMEVQVSGLWLRLCHRPPLLLQHPVLQSLVRCDGFSCRDHLTLSLTPPLPLLFSLFLFLPVAVASSCGGRWRETCSSTRCAPEWGVRDCGVPRKNHPLVSHCCSLPPLPLPATRQGGAIRFSRLFCGLQRGPDQVPAALACQVRRPVHCPRLPRLGARGCVSHGVRMMEMSLCCVRRCPRP